MGVLDSVGYKFAVQGGVIEVSKVILVVMKEKRIGNLYKLDVSTEESYTVVVFKDARDSFCLWHQRLGHINEKWHKILVDHKLLPNLKYLNLKLYKHCMFGKNYR